MGFALPSFVLPTLLACLAFGIGTAMMKHGVATKIPGISLARATKEWRSVLSAVLANRLWLGGLAASLAGGLFQVVALSRGELSLVQPLVNLNVAITVGAGVALMGERVSRREGAGLAVILAGAVLLGMSATDPGDPVVDRRALWILFAAAVILCLAVGAALVTRRGASAELGLAALAGILFGLAIAFVKVLSMEVAGIVEAVGASAGPGAARAAVFAAAAHLARSPATWIVVAANLVAFVALQAAFSHGRVAVVSPVTTILSVLVPVIAGIVVLSEDPGWLRWAGIVSTVVGTVVLASRGEGRDPKST